MKKFLLFLLLSITLLIFVFSSCKTEDQTFDPTPEQDNAMAENESDKVIQAVNATVPAVDLDSVQSEVIDFLPACATVSIDTINTMRTITIDFGTEPCLCAEWDTRYREGKIIATWSGGYRDSSTVITIITQDYFQGDLPSQMNKFEYSKTVTNMGHNVNGNLHYAVNVSQALITLYNSETITWTSQRDREWTAGDTTLLILDDVYSITGSASGIDRNGDTFTANITTALIVKLNCPWITQGTIEISAGTNPTVTLYYGDGTCDNDATVSVNGNTFIIQL